MKTKLLLSLFLAAAFTLQQATAQNYIVIEDFEDPEAHIPLNNMTDGDVSDEEAFEVIENPDPDEVNDSQYVLQYTRAANGNVWGGFWSEVFEPLQMDDMKYTHYQVWKPRISPLRFKVEGSDETEDFEHESMDEQTITDGWENITFHFPDAAGEYPVIALMPDFSDPVDLEENIVIYIDNIILSDSPDDPLATSIEQGEIPVHMALKQNYPNPFNPATNITFELNNPGQVTLKVYDMLGKEIATIADGHYNSGQHHVNFNADGLSSGMYLYRLQTADRSITRTMTLVK
ncbi:T9SS type A sorting domain-containing protein [Rhodohalobacter sp. SW132]|uniref:T9SS type A sorting domain-containing protein n=1 Tax=Rhodohalobacter sp. SW132 TaxID=2293433 RepID=UPI0013149722|nr:T9SS type A sorting domain-containing protein [Rhodohalobacter sp. SW132]